MDIVCSFYVQGFDKKCDLLVSIQIPVEHPAPYTKDITFRKKLRSFEMTP